jgi:hypothetical protein
MLDGGPVPVLASRLLDHIPQCATFLFFLHTHTSVRRKEMADVNTAPAMRFAPSIIVHETC